MVEVHIYRCKYLLLFFWYFFWIMLCTVPTFLCWRYISYFSHFCGLARSNLRKERFILAHSLGIHPIVGSRGSSGWMCEEQVRSWVNVYLWHEHSIGLLCLRPVGMAKPSFGLCVDVDSICRMSTQLLSPRCEQPETASLQRPHTEVS